jgi:hypothetical protein
MPTSRYDKFFGGQPGAADKALASMRRTYGRKDGETVFYATVAKRKHRGSRPAKGTKGFWR